MKHLCKSPTNKKVKEPLYVMKGTTGQPLFCSWGGVFFLNLGILRVCLQLSGLLFKSTQGRPDFHLFCFQFCYHSSQLISHFMMLMVGARF